MRFTHVHDPDLPGLPRMNIGSIIGGRGRNHELRGAYTVSDFCTAYVNVRFNAEPDRGDRRRRHPEDPRATARPRTRSFRYEIEFPPALERGLGRLAKAAVDVPKTEPVVQMVRRNLAPLDRTEPEHFGVRLPQSYAGNATTHLWPRASRAVSTGRAAGTRTITTCTSTSRTCSSARGSWPSPRSRPPCDRHVRP